MVNNALLARDLSFEIETSISNRAYTTRKLQIMHGVLGREARLRSRWIVVRRRVIDQHGAPYPDIETVSEGTTALDRYDRRDRDADGS